MILHFVRSFSRDSVQVVRSPDALKIVSNFPPTAHFPETAKSIRRCQADDTFMFINDPAPCACVRHLGNGNITGAIYHGEQEPL